MADKRRATNWITVGASGDPKLGTVVAGFSNYGKKEVDVFAPGMQIYSTIPEAIRMATPKVPAWLRL
jgi:subtilisin family serine protease